MKFEEQNAMTIQKIDEMVYFLLENEEVVYVGYTKNGFINHYAHKHKEYDTVKAITDRTCPAEYLADKYIVKYSPKYNKKFFHKPTLKTARDLVKFNTQKKRYSLIDLRRDLSKLQLPVYWLNGMVYTDYGCVHAIEKMYEQGVFQWQQ